MIKFPGMDEEEEKEVKGFFNKMIPIVLVLNLIFFSALAAIILFLIKWILLS